LSQELTIDAFFGLIQPIRNGKTDLPGIVYQTPRASSEPRCSTEMDASFDWKQIWLVGDSVEDERNEILKLFKPAPRLKASVNPLATSFITDETVYTRH